MTVNNNEVQIKNLLDNGKKNGKVSTAQIYEFFDKVIFDIKNLSELVNLIKSNNIEIVKEVPFYDESAQTDDSTKRYIEEIKKATPLSCDKENEIFEKALKGDRSARGILINSNLMFCVSVAKRNECEEIPFIDLIQDASLGFVKAFNETESENFAEFLVFAMWHMESVIKTSLSEYDRLTSIPSQIVERMREIKNTQVRLEKENGTKPTDEEVAQELGIDEAKVHKILHMAEHNESDNHSNDEDDDGEE